MYLTFLLSLGLCVSLFYNTWSLSPLSYGRLLFAALLDLTLAHGGISFARGDSICALAATALSIVRGSFVNMCFSWCVWAYSPNVERLVFRSLAYFSLYCDRAVVTDFCYRIRSFDCLLQGGSHPPAGVGRFDFPHLVAYLIFVRRSTAVLSFVVVSRYSLLSLLNVG